MSARRAALCPPRARSYFFASPFFGSPSENERSREYRTAVLLLAGGTRFLNFSPRTFKARARLSMQTVVRKCSPEIIG